MKKLFYYTLILIGLGISGNSVAQSVRAEATLDKASIPIGDQTTLRLSIHFAAKDSVSFPILKDSIGKIQIVKINKADTTFDKNDLNAETITKNIIVTGFDPGYFSIPAYTFTTKSGTFKTDSLKLQITPVAVDTTKAIYDIKQPLAVNYTFLDWIKDNRTWLLVGLFAVLAIAGLIYYLIKRPKKPLIIQKPKIIIPAHKIALDKLQALRDKKLWQNDQVKAYYIELSDILREYLEKRYAIKTLEQTTDELFVTLKYVEITAADRNMLRQTLVLADLVKFAREKPLPAENEQSLENAITFVNNTQQIIQLPLNQGGQSDGLV